MFWYVGSMGMCFVVKMGGGVATAPGAPLLTPAIYVRTRTYILCMYVCMYVCMHV